MNNEIVKQEAVESIAETGKSSGSRKVVKTVGIIGVCAGLAFVVCKIGKKLITKVKATKNKTQENNAATQDAVPDDMFEDLGELE